MQTRRIKQNVQKKHGFKNLRKKISKIYNKKFCDEIVIIDHILK